MMVSKINHLATQATPILVSLPEWGVLEISGLDAKKFLQGQLTCDIDKISVQQGTLGAHCNPQGRIISFFYLFFFQNAYYLVMQRHMVPVALLALKKYSVFYKTALNEVSTKWNVIGYSGSGPHEMILASQLPIITLPAASPRYLSLIPEEKRSSLWHELTSHWTFASPDTWKRLDILEKIPTIYPETSGQFLPHELNLPELNAVSFDKGCYTGQEIIARIHYRGKVKKQLYHAKITTTLPLLPGSIVYNTSQHEVGTIVDFYHVSGFSFQVLMIAESSYATDHSLFLDQEQQAPFSGLE